MVHFLIILALPFMLNLILSQVSVIKAVIPPNSTNEGLVAYYKVACNKFNTRKHQIIPFQEIITSIEKNKLYSDFLFSNGSKVYVIEVPEENPILIFFFTIDTENATLEVKLEGPVDRMSLSLVYDPMPYIFHVGSKGEVRIIITNPQGNAVYYGFFVDISEPLGNSNSKILPLEGGQVGFHVNLRRDDGVFLNIDNSNQLDLRIRVFALCYEVVRGEGSYMLCFLRESLNKKLYFTADLGGRYYILVESVKGEGMVSLKSVITSPPWNQEWFWLVFNIAFITIISPFFITRIKRAENLERSVLHALISYYCCFIAIGLSASLIGSFNYGAPISIPLFYLFIFFYGLSLGIQIYAAHLDRKKTIGICPYCGRKLNIKKDNYCCGKMVKNISTAWFLMPLSLGFLFFIVSYIIFQWILPKFIRTSLWMGSLGTFIGGIIAWWINRNIHRKKPWEFFAVGAIFSIFSPLLIGFPMDMSFRPHIELELPSKFVRTRIAQSTLPLGIIFAFAILAIGLGFLIVSCIRGICLYRETSCKNLSRWKLFPGNHNESDLKETTHRPSVSLG